MLSTKSRFLAAVDVTSDLAATLKPVTDEVATILCNVNTKVKALVGQPTDVILATVDGASQLKVADVANLAGGLISLIVTPLSDLKNNLSTDEVNDILTGAINEIV